MTSQPPRSIPPSLTSKNMPFTSVCFELPQFVASPRSLPVVPPSSPSASPHSSSPTHRAPTISVCLELPLSPPSLPASQQPVVAGPPPVQAVIPVSSPLPPSRGMDSIVCSARPAAVEEPDFPPNLAIIPASSPSLPPSTKGVVSSIHVGIRSAKDIIRVLYPPVHRLSPEMGRNLVAIHRYPLTVAFKGVSGLNAKQKKELPLVEQQFHCHFAGLPDPQRLIRVAQATGRVAGPLGQVARVNPNSVTRGIAEGFNWVRRGVENAIIGKVNQGALSLADAEKEVDSLLGAVIGNVAAAAKGMAENGPAHTQAIAQFLHLFTDSSEIGNSLVEMALQQCLPQLKTALAKCLVEFNQNVINGEYARYAFVRPGLNGIMELVPMTALDLNAYFGVGKYAGIFDALKTAGTVADVTRHAVLVSHLLRYVSCVRAVQQATINQDGSLSLNRLLMADEAIDPVVSAGLAGVCEIAGTEPQKLLPVLAGAQLLMTGFGVACVAHQAIPDEIRDVIVGSLIEYWNQPSADWVEQAKKVLGEYWDAPSADWVLRLQRAVQEALIEAQQTTAVHLEQEQRRVANALRESRLTQVSNTNLGLTAGRAVVQTAVNASAALSLFSVAGMIQAAATTAKDIAVFEVGRRSGEIGGKFMGDMADKGEIDAEIIRRTLQVLAFLGKLGQVMSEGEAEGLPRLQEVSEQKREDDRE